MPYEDDERDEPVAIAEVSEDDEKLLKEIRETYRYFYDSWAESREERRKDMRVICGDPWDPADRQARKEAGRPCINHDETNQYHNQAINKVRQNKRGIKVEPEGEGADEKTADYRQNRIRAIEYRSKAQTVYLSGFQDLIEGGYGFWRITRRWVKGQWKQEIVISRIPNPDSVLYDPDCKELDWSDAKKVIVVEPMSREDFKRKYPKAQRKDFTAEDMRIAKDWITDKTILVAEFWRVEITEKTIEGVDAKGRKRTRTEEDKKPVQYITNGVEILARNEEPGEEIPIIPCIGLERWVDDGAGSKRKVFSLGRNAREPQMSHAYLVSQEMEEAGLSPKVPYMGYVGQFETDKDALDTLHKIPHPYVQIDPMPDSASGQILPLPRREQFTPNFAGYQAAKESTRRAIQAAMGISPLPTSAQRHNEKSGVALQQIDAQEQIGSYHFVAGLERAIERTGRIIESWLPVVDDIETEVPIRLADDTHKMVRINTDEPYTNDKGEQEHFPVEAAPHATTISVGPTNDSQHEAAEEFVNTLVSNLQSLPVAPPQAAKLLSLAIRLRQLGPLGDQMAEIISPDGQQEIPPQAQQMISQAQQHIQALNAYCQKVEQENQQLKMEKAAKVIDNQAKLALEDKRLESNLAIAEVTTKAQNLEERTKFLEDIWKQIHDQAHDVGMQAEDHAHESALTDQQGQIAQQQQEAQAEQQAQQQPEAA